MTTTYPVFLTFTQDHKTVYLRELTALDELGISDSGTVSAVQLLNRLQSVPIADKTALFRAETLVAADRDRLLAAIYKNTYNGLLRSTVPCTACAERFDLDFSLDALISHIQENTDTDIAVEQKTDGLYELSDGACFRLPTGPSASSGTTPACRTCLPPCTA